MEVAQAFFDVLTNPDIAYTLLIIGLLMVVLAFAVPGTGAVEAVAVVCLVLATIGLSRLPVNIAGVVLIVAGVALLIADLKVQSGLVALAGAVALGLGSLFLFQPGQSAVSVSLWLVALTTLGTAAFFGFGATRAMRAMRTPVRMGDLQSLVGRVGVLRTDLIEDNNYTGTAHIAGELWTVKSNQAIPAHSEVEVERVEGLTLIVRRHMLSRETART